MERRRGFLMSANSAEPIDLSNPNPNYLTIVALEDGLTASLSANAVEYSIDGNDNWTTLSAGTSSPAINKNHYISFRGTLTPATYEGVGTFTISKSCDLTGNCNSLLFGDNAKTNKSLSGKDYAFYDLFSGCTTIKNVSPNFLPATTLAEGCYYYMFYRCTSLTTAPDLPATTLARQCYYQMFSGCLSLTIAPSILPATTLARVCYSSMFRGCTSLIIAPELPATTLAEMCYKNMFYGCSKLNYIKAMFTTIPLSSCTDSWVSGVASSGTFVKNKNATWNVTGVSGIPSGWTVQTA